VKLRVIHRKPLVCPFVVIAIVGAAVVAVRYAGSGHNVTAGTVAPAVVAKQPIPVRAVSLAQSESEPVRISVSQQSPNVSPEDEDAFSSLVESEISQLHEGATLAQWINLHAANEGWTASTDENFFDCRTFVRTETFPSGRQVMRVVYFYPPVAPTPVVFPAAAGQALMDRTCTLAMIRVQTRTPAEQDGRALAQALQQHLAKKYGDSAGMKGAAFSGSAAWLDAARWRNDSEIVSAYNPTQAVDAPDDPGAGTVFAFARLPVVYEIEQNACCRMKEFHYRSIENTQFHRALGIAAIETSLTERVAKLFEALFRDTASLEAAESPRLQKSRAAVLPTLRDWLNTVSTLPPARHAAGLYAADRLLSVASDTGWQDLSGKETPELRTAFGAIGASFGYDELGASYCYAGDWLTQARELDPDGAVGQMAVLVSLARGGAPILDKNNSSDSNETFRTVIVDGEWLLAKNPDPATAAQIHFILGDAFSDIVALAGGAEPDYGDPAKYQPEADSARKKALEHYRAGLAVDGLSENAKDAWLQAWHLCAGLIPSTRYVYIYD
jgi:hypothetical protein